MTKKDKNDISKKVEGKEILNIEDMINYIKAKSNAEAGIVYGVKLAEAKDVMELIEKTSLHKITDLERYLHSGAIFDKPATEYLEKELTELKIRARERMKVAGEKFVEEHTAEDAVIQHQPNQPTAIVETPAVVENNFKFSTKTPKDIYNDNIERKKITFELNFNVWNILHFQSKSAGMTITQFIKHIIQNYIDKKTA